MPRDMVGNHPGYVKTKDTLFVNPFKVDKKALRKKRGKKNEVDRGLEQKELEPDEKGNYRVAEFGNYPLVQNVNLNENVEGELRPKNYVWRMKLPADADWNPKQADDNADDGKKKRKKKTKDADLG